MLSFKDSMKFLLLVCSYIGYPFVLYFAVMFATKRLEDHKHDFSECRQLYVYSIIFLGLYIADTLRYFVFVILSIFSHKLTRKTGTGMFLVNSLMLSYGVLLVYTVDKNCLSEYDIKDYLCVSGVGLLFSIVTHVYNNFDSYFKNDQPSTLNTHLLYSTSA
jgi:hypothetical protein